MACSPYLNSSHNSTLTLRLYDVNELRCVSLILKIHGSRLEQSDLEAGMCEMSGTSCRLRKRLGSRKVPRGLAI